MKQVVQQGSIAPVSPAVSAALASSAFVVPLLLSMSTTPTPNHPRVFLWYRSLSEPAIQPPDLAIPIAWTAIETGLAVAAYRLLRSRPSPARSRAIGLMALNIAGIGGWSRLFFGGRNLPLSTAAAAALAVGAGALVRESRKVDRTAAVASVPLVLWVTFATILTAALWRRNG